MNDDNQKLTNKNKKVLIFGIAFLIIVLLGSTYAFFTYSKSVQAFTLTSDTIKAEFISGTNSINITNAYPISDEFALANLDKLSYIDFTVSSTINDPNKAISYELYLTGDTTNTLDSNYIKVYLTDENNNQVVSPKIYNNLENTTYQADKQTGKVIYIGNNPGTKTNKYRLYAWIDKDYEQNTISQTFKFNLNIYAYNDNKLLSSVFIKDLKEKQTDTCKTYIEEDDITYVSGTKDCINFNYVWYSGKLWRITAINKDGTMKMITDDPITAISYNPKDDVNFYDVSKKDDTTYTGSYMYQFLNEDFLDTLYNYQNIIVEDSTWNITTSSIKNTKLPETTLINSSTIGKNTPVGLLNIYEYYLSYKNTSLLSGYLNIGYGWWLLNPNSSFRVWYVNCYGDLHDGYPSNEDAARPSINLKSNIQLSGGSGTKDDPYTISGDKKQPTINTTLLNKRTIGEYVVFDEDADTSTKELYRIVGIEDGKTKLNKNDYIKSGTTTLTKKFSTNTTYGSGTSDDYWDYYLNNTWYNSLANKDMLESSSYYIKRVSYGTSYKNSLCNTNNTTETTKDCVKTTSVWNLGYVGLPRSGEMFASQQGNGSNSSSDMWLITPYDPSYVWFVNSQGHLNYTTPSYAAARPSINLKSNIVITGGSGTKSDPFTIALKD